MIREIIHIIPLRNFAEEAMNCWLSYTMAQPVYFDLGILMLFALQYLGIKQLWKFVRASASLAKLFQSTQHLQDDLTEDSKTNFSFTWCPVRDRNH